MRSHAKAASVLVFLAMLLGIAAPAASAAPTATTAWVYQSSFGTGEYAYNLSPYKSGLAIEGGSGNILAPDEGNQVVRVYEPDASLGGVPLTTFTTGGFPVGIAVDRETDAVYVNEEFFGDAFQRYLSDGASPPSYTLDPNFTPSGGDGAALAIDPTTHDVLALTGRVERFDPETGELLASFGVGSATYKYLIAVGLDGTIYLSGEGSEILRFSPAGTPLSKFPLPGIARGLTVDPETGDVVVALDNTLIGFAASGEKIFEVPIQSGGSIGLAVDPGRDRLYNRNPATGSIDAYVPAPYAGVEEPTVSAITTTGFHVSTEVDPGEKEGGGVPDESAVHFEYRLQGEEGWTATPPQAVSAAGVFEADIAGLEPNLIYEVRAVASNSQTSHVTDAVEATTAPVPPATETGAATDVTETAAVLNGTINPIGLQTTYYFEYGTTTAYGSRVPVSIEAVAGGGRTVQAFSRTITGLTPGTTYHFRLVATNAAGTATGSDRTFTTIVVGGIPFRAYEQVTPADKQGAAIIPRLGFQAKGDGNGISYTTKSGSQSSPLVTRAVAVRGSSDWQGKIDTDPPLNVGSGTFLIGTTLAVSDDFTRALVVSNRALTPGAVEGGGNLYLEDLPSHAYKLVGASGAANAFNSFVGSKASGRYQAGAPDFSWVVFSSNPPLLPGAPTDAIYRWSETDGLEVASTLPNGDMSKGVFSSSASTYKTTSADGSRIYFTAVGGAEKGVFLRENGGQAKPVSVSHVPGDPTTPQPATLLGVNEDGRYAFLTSATKLTSDAPGVEGDLYRYDAADDSLEYLGAQAYVDAGLQLGYGGFGVGADGRTFYFNARSEFGGLGNLSVWHDGEVHSVMPSSLLVGNEHMSPSGRYFVVQEIVGGTSGVVEVYDAETDQLSCVSCLPDGTPVAGQLPEGGELYVSNRYPQTVDDGGTVYFDTTARMVAADVNGTRDVYASKGGIADLISPGNRSFDAIFADVSTDGSNVFFTTAQKLVGRDNDESVDVYDARVNGGLPAQSPPPPQECLRDDCKATPNAGPELPFGGSEALSGPENVKPHKHKRCGKGKRAKKVKGKVRCVKKHKANKGGKGGNR